MKSKDIRASVARFPVIIPPVDHPVGSHEIAWCESEPDQLGLEGGGRAAQSDRSTRAAGRAAMFKQGRLIMERCQKLDHLVLLRRMALAGMAGALAVALGAAMADAQDKYPSETIEMVSHAAPGGGTDVTARLVLEGAKPVLGVDMVMVYKEGGAARASHEYLMSRPADGHTVIALTQTHLYTIARGNSNIGIDDITGVARAMDDSSLIVVGANTPHQTYEDLIEASKQNPIAWGVAQVGGTEHIGLARWAEAAGIEYRVVPFGSGGEMLTALRSGAVEATIANVSEALGLIEEGEVRPIAVMDEERIDDLADVPTTFEKGHEVKVTTTRGYAVRADTPPETIKALEEALLAGMETEAFQEYLRNSGLDPEDSIAGSAEWDSQLKEEYAESKEVIDRLGL